jgi:deoxyinosine 3'endonuclease (endonuclease V)
LIEAQLELAPAAPPLWRRQPVSVGACFVCFTRGGEVVGAWVRTRAGARPLAVHAAWRTDLETAVQVALRACMRARTPELMRAARLAREGARLA